MTTKRKAKKPETLEQHMRRLAIILSKGLVIERLLKSYDSVTLY